MKNNDYLGIIERLEDKIGEKIFESDNKGFEEFDNGICKYVVDDENNIIRIRLIFDNIKEIPDEIFIMKQLLELDCSFTQIKEIPETITRLVNLQTLDLSSTQIKEIPEIITRLVNLQTLYLSSTQIKEIPETITRLVNLQTLYLRSTQIKEIPETITRLVNLQTLYLSSTQIKEIPETITRLVNLQTLDLSSTQIKEIPETITRLVNLQTLYLRSTQIKGIPETITRLVNLQTLDLRSTQIKEIPETITSLVNLQTLDLRSTQIKEIPETITRLVNLQTLDLSSTQIKEIPETITRLVNLQTLYLRSTQIKEIPETITRLVNLQTLDLRSTQIKEIPEPITRLVNLQTLDLSSTQIKEIPETIIRLVNLQTLDLSSTQIKEIPEIITRLVNLQTLDLSSTQIKEISETITRLVNLQTLDLSSTQIKEIPETITRLVNLQTLYLSNTQIKEIPKTIAKLVNLQTLDLRSTQIKEIPETIIRLKKLKVLDISDTNINCFTYTLLKIKMPIFNMNRIDFVNNNFWIYGYKYFFKKRGIYVKFHEAEIKGVYVNKLSFDNVPDEVIEQGRNFITDYLNTKKEITINEFKILLIGKGAAGKTSLLKCLKKEEFDEQEDTTHGISIRDYKFNYNKNEYESKIWDFGGQDIMHSTHKFFLSERCFYIVVLDGRQDDNVEYWLKHIKSFGGDSPILVVINKMDMYPNTSLNEKYLIDKYKNIKAFYKISCKKCENIDKVEEGIKKYLYSIENINIAWPESWLKVKNKLEENSYNYISYENYEDHCIKFGIENKETQNNLLRYLNDLGVICDFSNWKLKERKVLNPKWITIGVYKVITSEKIKINNGYLKVKDLDEIINKECKNEEFEKVFKNECYNYNLSEQKYMLDLMEDFELCYFVDKETILIPSSLNDSETEHEINKNDTLEYRYVYNFMSKSIIHRLIVRMKSYVDKKNVWSTGVVLKDRSNDVKALVKLDEEERTIYINIKGDFGRDLLANIRKEINEINDSLKDVSEGVEEFVIKDGSKISYKSILIHYQKGKYTILAENGNEYIVTELLGDIQSLDLLDRKIINVRGDLHMDEIKGNKINEVKGDSVGEDKVVISGNTGQVNYAKDNAKIDATMNVDNRSVNLDGIDKEKLFEQLSKLEEAFAKNKMYKEAGEINEAIEEKNESKVIKFLKASGQKVLQIAETTGLPLVVEIVKNRLGICE